MYTLKLTHAYVQPHLLVLDKTSSDSVDLGTLYNSATQRTFSPHCTASTAFAMLTSSQFLYFPSRNMQKLALQFLTMAEWSDVLQICLLAEYQGQYSTSKLLHSTWES